VDRGGLARVTDGSGEGGRRREPVIFAFQEPGEFDAGAVAVLRADDLHAHGQARLGESDRCHRGGQVAETGIACPEQLIDTKNALAKCVG